MGSLLEKLKRCGRKSAAIPVLVALGVTVPKLYLEAKAAGMLGETTFIESHIVDKYREHSNSLVDNGCRIGVEVNPHVQREQLSCERWALVKLGDTVFRADAWTVYIDPDDAQAEVVLDFVVLSVLSALTMILFKSSALVEWMEVQANIPANTTNLFTKNGITA